MMTIANWCVLIAIFLPYVAFSIGTKLASDQGIVRDNRNPRDFPNLITGSARRAWSAHLNSFEALPAFAAAVIIAQLAQAPQFRVDILALVWVVVRIAYVWLYIADQDKLRSSANLAGLACVVGLFILAA